MEYCLVFVCRIIQLLFGLMDSVVAYEVKKILIDGNIDDLR